MRARIRDGLRLAIAGGMLLALVSIAGAATITIVNGDGAGEGFNDPTPAAPVGGNPATTIGTQRLYVFQHAANIWGGILPSNVEIRVAAQFSPQTPCDATSGVLGGASAGSSHRNFANAPFTDTWYQQALANKLAGFDLSANADINITFNSDVGKPTCLTAGWYYGVDGNEGSKIELLPVVLHELGHGLGFATITLAGVESGTPPSPHVYDRFLYDRTQGMHWNEMTEGQRAASAQNCQQLAWDGPQVVAHSKGHLGPKPFLRVNSPPTVAGVYDVGTAAFGAPLAVPGITENLEVANDGVGVPTNGCEPFLNSIEVSGHIAFVDRGGCPFTVKVKNAQNAGAIAVVVADSMPGCPAAGMSGFDPSITIPTVRVTHDDGLLLKSGIPLGINVTLSVDPTLDAGADPEGRVLVYTPIPFAQGSSVSHWDVSATPNLLMEPAINPDLSSSIDLAYQQMIDIGWFNDQLGVPEPRRVATNVFLGAPSPNPTARGATITFRIDRPEYVRLAVADVSGRTIRKLHEGMLPAGEHRLAWDGRTEAMADAPIGLYFVSLRTSDGVKSRGLVMAR